MIDLQKLSIKIYTY